MVAVHLAACKYPVLRHVAAKLGYNTVEEDFELESTNFNLLWADTVIPTQRLSQFSNWQRFNHFAGMYIITRKHYLATTMGRLKKLLPEHFSYVPNSWALKTERQAFAKYMAGIQTASGAIISSSNADATAAAATAASKKFFIMKPNAGCQGRGIFITRDPLDAVEDPESYIVQEYITRPLLISGKKFDLRVYALLTSIRTPSIFVYHDGLVRICAEAYERPTDANVQISCKHLTNYAVNKTSNQFEFNSSPEGDGSAGNKRDFKWFNTWLDSLTDADLGDMHANTGKRKGQSRKIEAAALGVGVTRSAHVWSAIDFMITKTILAAQPHVNHTYTTLFPHSNDGFTCFEILGFDVMLDERLNPWLIEVNHTPSLACDTPLDRRIKENLVTEAISILNLSPKDRQRSNDKERSSTFRRIQGGAGPKEPEKSASPPWTLEGHRRAEDAHCVGFRRVYPDNSEAGIEHQHVYDEILGAAKGCFAVQTTAAQEQRQLEIRAAREKREAEVSQRNSKRAPSTAAPTATLKPSMPARSESAARARQPRPAPRDPPKDDTAKAQKEAADRRRERLEQQMERHRRRMELGSRLSVFQLKEAQLYVNEGVVLGDLEGSAAYMQPVGEMPKSRLAPTTSGDSSGRSLLQYFKTDSEALTNVISRVDMLRRVSLHRQNSQRQLLRPKLLATTELVYANGDRSEPIQDDDTGDEIYCAHGHQPSPYKSMHYENCEEE